MFNQTIDEIDLQILQCLRENALQSHKAIGMLVHMTGQAVGARVRKLQDMGVIEGYTVRWNADKVGLPIHALLTVFMKSGMAHQAFLAFVRQNEQVEEVHRVSGEGCYWMRVRAAAPAALNAFLEQLLNYGNYKLSLSIDRIK